MPIASWAAAQPSPPRMASPLMSHATSEASRAPAGHVPCDELAREVAASEVELRVLRAEVEAKEKETVQLADRVRDAEVELLAASGVVGTLSAKAETSSGNRQKVLEASARQIDSQVVALRKQVARMDWQLAAKDEEIRGLQEASRVGDLSVMQQQSELGALKRRQNGQDEHAATLTQDARHLERLLVADRWREEVETKIAVETAAKLGEREQRAQGEVLSRLQEEKRQLRKFTNQAEGTRRHLQNELQVSQRQYDALLLEARLSSSASQLGCETVFEQLKNQSAEHRMLEGRLRHESARAAQKAPLAAAYDASEIDAMRGHYELESLTCCVKEITRVLSAVSSFGAHLAGDPVDRAVTAFLRAARDTMEPLPPVIRVGGGEYLIAKHLVRCVVQVSGVAEGRLCVQAPNMRLLPIADFIRELPGTAYMGHDGFSEVSTRFAAPPAAVRQRSLSPPPSLSQFAVRTSPPVDPAAAPRQQAQGRRNAPDGSSNFAGSMPGLASFMVPMQIGSSEPLMTV